MFFEHLVPNVIISAYNSDNNVAPITISFVRSVDITDLYETKLYDPGVACNVKTFIPNFTNVHPLIRELCSDARIDVASHSVCAKGAQDVSHYDDNQVDNGSHRNNDTVYHYYIRVSVTKVRSYFET